MSASIEQAVMKIKHDVSKAFDAAAIVALCRSIGYSWRTRQFDPVATIQGFLLKVLHCNTACSHVPRLLGKDVTAEAYGMAGCRWNYSSDCSSRSAVGFVGASTPRPAGMAIECG